MTNMSLERKLLCVALGLAIAPYGCRTQTTNEARQSTPVSITGEVITPSSYKPTFQFYNYKRLPRNDQERAAYWGAFDIEPVQAEDFSAISDHGKIWSFQASAAQKDYVLLEFTGYDCVSCRELIPHLENFYAKNKKKIGLISIVNAVDLDDWKKYVAEHHVEYPLLLDLEGTILEKYGFTFVPSMVLIHKGKVISVCSGFEDYAVKWLLDIEKSINQRFN